MSVGKQESASLSLEGDNLLWCPSIEQLLAGWCDQEKCYEWMHTEAHSHFDSRAKRLMVSVNILVAVSGMSNIAAGNAQVGGFQVAWLFGGLSVLTSLINMLQEKLGWQQSADQHKQQAARHGAIRRKLEEELSMPAAQRRDCPHFMRSIREEISATSGVNTVQVPEFIRDACYERFSSIKDFDVPDICGQLEHTRVFVNGTLTCEAAELSKPLI